MRPSLKGVPAKEIDPDDRGILLGTLLSQEVRSSWEDVLLAIMAPRSGKTSGLAIPAVLRAPGPVLLTSNKAAGDAYTTCLDARSTLGKMKPIKQQVRELLGYPHPIRVPRGVFVDQWIGISVDEIHRAKDSGIGYMRNKHPLLDLGYTRSDCQRLLRANGFGETPKSACLGCPFHGNQQWRALRDESPEEWADVVEFDAAIRSGNARATAAGSPLLGQAYLHRSLLPLSIAPIDRVTAHEWNARQGDVFDAVADAELEAGDADGCSPWACRSGSPVREDFGEAA